MTTLPNEAVSLKGKQLRTLSCVPAWLKLLTSVLFMRCLFSVPLSMFSKRFFDFIFGARPYWIFQMSPTTQIHVSMLVYQDVGHMMPMYGFSGFQDLQNET